MNPNNKLPQINSKLIFISGATGHIGKPIARYLCQQGAHALLNSRSNEKCKRLEEAIRKEGGSCETVSFDIADEGAVSSFFESYKKKPILGIVNAAHDGTGGTVKTSTADEFRLSLNTAVVGSHNLLRHALPSLELASQKYGDASVILFSSIYGIVSPRHAIYETSNTTNPPFYGAGKAAINQYVKYAACELAQNGIRVNGIAPGPFPAKNFIESQPEAAKKILENIPIKRFGIPEDLCGPVAFLLDKSASYITGQTLIVDGGYTAW